MTAYSTIFSKNRSHRNIKDGGPRWQPPVQSTGFWGVAGFMPTRQPGQWCYTWPAIDCPAFKVIEAGKEITATIEGGEIEATFTNTSHIEVKDWMDDRILELMRLQADVDGPPLVVAGQEMGPEIEF
jgi:hypothetical protein